MDLAFEHKHWQKSPLAQDAQADCSFTPDWHSLLARLDATRSARSAMNADQASQLTACGSFAQPAAQAMATFDNSSPAVNLTALANGKVNGGIAASVDSESSADGRGKP